MGIRAFLKGFGQGAPDLVRFTNENTALAVYVVDDTGGPAPGATALNYIPATGGIVDTTGVVIAPAQAGKVNYIASGTVANGSATGTEWEIRNGASGPVIGRGYAPPNSLQPVFFTPEINGSVGALLEFAALTTGAKLYGTFNGYTS